MMKEQINKYMNPQQLAEEAESITSKICEDEEGMLFMIRCCYKFGITEAKEFYKKIIAQYNSREHLKNDVIKFLTE